MQSNSSTSYTICRGRDNFRLGLETPRKVIAISSAYRLDSSGVKNVGIGALSLVILNMKEKFERANCSAESMQY